MVNLKYPFFKYISFILKLLYLTLTYDLRINEARKYLGYTGKGWAMYELTDASNKTTKRTLMLPQLWGALLIWLRSNTRTKNKTTELYQRLLLSLLQTHTHPPNSLKGTQLIHIPIRYHFSADLHVTRCV